MIITINLDAPPAHSPQNTNDNNIKREIKSTVSKFIEFVVSTFIIKIAIGSKWSIKYQNPKSRNNFASSDTLQKWNKHSFPSPHNSLTDKYDLPMSSIQRKRLH